MVRIAQMSCAVRGREDVVVQSASHATRVSAFSVDLWRLLCSLRVTRLGSVLFLWICGGCCIIILRAIGDLRRVVT